MTTALCRYDVRVGPVVPDGGLVWRETLDDPRSRPTLAHSPAWFQIIRDVYGHEPLYLSAEGPGGDRAVLPSFIVRRPLGGAVIMAVRGSGRDAPKRVPHDVVMFLYPRQVSHWAPP